MSRLSVLAVVLFAVGPAFAQDVKLYIPYPDGGIPVGDFRLQERSGKYVMTRDLLGKVWVAQFFYPGCNQCSKNTPTMKRLQDHYRGKTDVRLVSIDLANNDLDTLEAFAKDHDAELDQWWFLTGPDASNVAGRCFFKIAMPSEKPTPGDTIVHQTHLVLVDANGMMTGYVDGTQPGAAEALIEQIDLLRVRRRQEGRIPITGADLPRFNAVLNSCCTVLLLLGWVLIRLRFETLHKLTMLLALAVSMIFLASYLFYHFVVMEMEPTRFRGEGTVRYVYFAILLTHTILAIVVAPMAIYITAQGLRNALAAHVKMARWTLPIWLYVSITGVAVYWMLYRMEY